MSKRHEVNDGEYHSQPTPKSSKWVLKKWRPTKKSGEGSSVRQEAVEEEVVVEKTNPPRWVTIGKDEFDEFGVRKVYPPDVDYRTDQIFKTFDDLFDWVKQKGRENGYALNRRRSNPNKLLGKVGKGWIKCDRSGKLESIAKVKKTGSKKCGCPFMLYGVYNGFHAGYEVEIECDSHNHRPSQHLEAHAYARRLRPQEDCLVGNLMGQNMPPQNILSTIKNEYPDNVSTLKAIYNAQDKIKTSRCCGNTPMEIFQNELQRRGYVYHIRADPVTDITQEIFFVSPTGYTCWRAFPHVLIIDATYKTNKYNLPLVELVGVTSTGNSFFFAHAILSNERQDSYTWLLEAVKDLLSDVYQPSVIVTDRELALVNACDKVFPQANHQLCRIHIWDNITKHWQKSFGNCQVYKWKDFQSHWWLLVDSPNENQYHKFKDRIFKKLAKVGRLECLKYLDDYWLTNYRFRFVTCWTSSRRNYGENTTNRAESEHHALKSHLRTRRATLEHLVGFIEVAQRTQLGELKEKLGTSRIKTMAHHANIRLFDRIRGRVSIKCLDLLYKEIDRLHRVLKVHNFSCGHQLYTGCGIPCACRLEQMLEIPDYVMPLEDIDPFWRKLNYEKSAYPGKFDEFHGDEGLDRSEAESNEYAVTQPKSSQKSTFEKMMNFWNKARPSPKYKEPEVKTNTRGRPTTKAKEERDEQRAQEQARHSSYTGPKNSYTEPPRYSSYVGSQETVDLGQSSQKKQTQAKKGKKKGR
ncbi:hypothetical protein SSX86_031634 [Deinandra increscens subsp. villosa]|uniref:MULE transposase domain-containing protein n=1 Tax=Deinandra increscens subsp. villosa TaxID=3103831 RepID=A0AAP0C3U3_9ASTR